MKRIRTLSDPPQGLATYLEECANGKVGWELFRDHSAGVSYRELAQTLVALQHGLCGYCEIDLIATDRQVEHVIPRSDPSRGTTEELNCDNMIACCLGGTAKNLHGTEAADDDERFLEPARRNISCGQAKDQTRDPAFVDPRTLPELPSVVKVNPNGEIEADSFACATCGVDATHVNRTIEILGLNVDRLRSSRAKHWSALSRNWSDYFDDRDVMEAAARSELLPQSNGHLPRFFTTSRSYFAPYGESILQQNVHRWV